MQIMPFFLVYHMKIIKIVVSSNKTGDYNSCNAENSASNCTICDETLNKVLKVNSTGNYCEC